MSDKLRELVEEMRECVESGEPMKFRYVGSWADRLEALLPTERVARDGWLLDGNLIYKLSEDRNPCNTHEVRVTQWSGSREKRDCDAAANVLFCNSFNTTPTEPAPDREDAERLDRWSEIAREGTDSDWQMEQSHIRRWFAARQEQA